MEEAKKRVTEANHNVIYKFMLSETTKCEIDSSAELLNLNGEYLLKCSDFFGSDISTSKINHAMKNYFNAHIKHAYRDEVLIFPGHYTASCLPSGNSPDDGGFGEQGTQHLAVGWWPNEKKLTLYLDTCIESSGKALSKVYHIRGKE